MDQSSGILLGMILCVILCVISSCFSSLRKLFEENEQFNDSKKNVNIKEKEKKNECSLC